MNYLSEEELRDIQRTLEFGPSGVLNVMIHKLKLYRMLSEIMDSRSKGKPEPKPEVIETAGCTHIIKDGYISKLPENPEPSKPE